jgi:hypothetical protein
MIHVLCDQCPNVNVCLGKCAGIKGLSNKDKIRIWFWNKIGAYCRICGYDKSIRALHLHHLDKSQKENPKDCLSLWLTQSPELVVEKCIQSKFIIVCANCHAEIHAGIIQLDKNYKGDNNFQKNEIMITKLKRAI